MVYRVEALGLIEGFGSRNCCLGQVFRGSGLVCLNPGLPGTLTTARRRHARRG